MPRAIKNTGIYIIQNIINRKAYVGSAVDVVNRWCHHLFNLDKGTHHSIKLQRAWKKYGEENFTFRTIERCKKKNLTKREQFYMNRFNSVKNGYNVQPNARSCLGVKHNKEFGRKISNAQLRLCATPEEKQYRSKRAKKQHKEKNFGIHTWTKESKKNASRKLSLASKRNWQCPKFREKWLASRTITSNKKKRLNSNYGTSKSP